MKVKNMDFYSVLFAKSLGGGGKGQDPNETFKLYVSNKLTDITEEMLDGLTSIGKSAFEGCSPLESITIPSSVTSIGSYAFNACTNLPSITIPNSVSIMGSQIFGSCYKLKSVTISNSCTSIPYNMFINCIGLESVTIPNSVTLIDTTAFASCSRLTSITIPSSVTNIRTNAFQYCTRLENVTVQRTTPPTLNSGVFSGTSNNLVIYVPAESVDTYKAASGWSTYADKIQAIPNE